MILVINEWIFHDLLCENGAVNFRQTAEFVVRLNSSQDVVVMPVEERWREKANTLRSATNPIQRQTGRLFVDLFWDSTRGIILQSEGGSGELPDLHSWAPAEDVYLIEACAASGADLLVTTDETLFDAVREHGSVECKMRDDFISTYCPSR